MSTFLTALAVGAGFMAGVMIVYAILIVIGILIAFFKLNKKEG